MTTVKKLLNTETSNLQVKFNSEIAFQNFQHNCYFILRLNERFGDLNERFGETK